MENVEAHLIRARSDYGGPMQTSPKGRRMTIAFLADYMSHFMGAYESQFRDSIVAECRKLDVNLLLVYGGGLTAPRSAENSIFDLIHPDRVDGVLLLSTSVASFAGPAKVLELVSRLSGLPCCSLGIALEDVPSVVIDNHASMEAIVEHVITVHGRRRIAFIGGTPDNPEAQIRHASFREVCRRHGVPVDPALFAYGNFWTRGAREAMQTILARGVEFDAVVCANDTMAQVLVGELAQRGIHVPRDVILTGFDDVYGSKLMSPPLTTAAQPFEAMTTAAVRNVLDQVLGRSVPMLTQLKAELIVRRSCGCSKPVNRTRVNEAGASGVSAIVHLRQERERIQRRLQVELRAIPGCENDGAEQLLQALESELSDQSGAFFEHIEVFGGRVGENPDHVFSLQRAIAYLRNELRPFALDGCEDLWHEARDVVELAIVRAQHNHRIHVEDAYLRLLEGSEAVSRALNRESFRASLSKSLPQLGIRTGAISRFVDGNRVELELMAGLVDQSLTEDERVRFPARLLMPEDIYPSDRRHTSVVLPIVLDTEALGVAAFEYSGDAVGYFMVRTQISAAISAIHLHQEVIEQSMQNERSLQERLSATKRMDALSVLAGGVAHDLNNALGPLVALPDVILADLDGATKSGDASELRRDVETVKSAALRAAQTIKDLLTLGRQGRTAKEPLDLAQLVASCMSSDLLRAIRAKHAQVRFRLEVPSTPHVIHASEPHIVRALTNLLHNAAEALSGAGEITVRVSGTRVTTPIQVFECIEPGDYVLVTVTDDGRGMPSQDLQRIFEPFFSRKRTDDHSGSGLGLAIVHSVVKEHDGFIDVVTELDVGTSFTLYFPRSEVMAFERPRVTKTQSRGRGRILIVDDEPIQLRTGSRVLGRLGYQVDTLTSGRLACERFKLAAESGASPYDLVILDMILNEEVDGLERFEQIRAFFPGQRAIVVSGHAPTERAEAAFEKGLAWLPKPYTADALLGAVEAALSERESDGQLRISCKRISVAPRVTDDG